MSFTDYLDVVPWLVVTQMEASYSLPLETLIPWKGPDPVTLPTCLCPGMLTSPHWASPWSQQVLSPTSSPPQLSYRAAEQPSYFTPLPEA